MKYIVNPVRTLIGQVQVPGDKSISHRTIIFGAIANGVSTADGFLEGEDAISTINAFREMGIKVEGPTNARVKIFGKGLYGLSAPQKYLDCGNSGTTMRLLSGLLSGQNFSSILIGDATLMRRPMRRVVEPLTQMGANISVEQNGNAPIKIFPTSNLDGIIYPMKIASAQVKSSLILSALYAKGKTTITEPAITRDHSERMLSQMGANITVDGLCVIVNPNKNLQLSPLNIQVPGDFSSAAFWMVAGSIADCKSTGETKINNVGMNPTRNGAITILQKMGANITALNHRNIGGEPVADLLIKPTKLKGINIPKSLVSLSIDEFPILFIAAAAAQGITKLTGAHELRVKESDRLASMANGLQVLGINHELLDDGIIIEGNDGKLWNGGEINSNGDHRIAMSFAVASLGASEPIIINDCQNVATSYPNFVEDAKKLGLDIVLN